MLSLILPGYFKGLFLSPQWTNLYSSEKTKPIVENSVIRKKISEAPTNAHKKNEAIATKNKAAVIIFPFL